MNSYIFVLGTIQLLRHQRGGCGQKMAILDDLQVIILAYLFKKKSIAYGQN